MIVIHRARIHGPPQTESSSALWNNRQAIAKKNGPNAGIANDLGAAV